MLPRSMEQINKRKLKVRHPLAMHRIFLAGPIILSAQLLKTYELMTKQGRRGRVNFKPSLPQTKMLNPNSPKVRKSDLACRRRVSSQLPYPNLTPSW